MPVSRPRDFNRRLPSAPSPGVFTARGKPQWIFIDPRQASYGPLVSAVAPPVVRSTFRAHAFPLRWFPCALVLCYSYVSAFLCVCFFFFFKGSPLPLHPHPHHHHHLAPFQVFLPIPSLTTKHTQNLFTCSLDQTERSTHFWSSILRVSSNKCRTERQPLHTKA